MIVHKILTISGLVQEMNRLAMEYCLKHRLPRISVLPDDGSIDPGARAHFNWKRQEILVSTRLLDYIWKYPDKIKVWCLFSAVRHELRHYEQYLFLRTRHKRLTKDMFDEDDTMSIARQYADSKIRVLTLGQINPILPAIASAAVTGVGLGAGFKLADVAWNRMFKKKNPRRKK